MEKLYLVVLQGSVSVFAWRDLSEGKIPYASLGTTNYKFTIRGAGIALCS
jgi:hypothetical protein